MTAYFLDVDPAEPVPAGTTCIILPPVSDEPMVPGLLSTLGADPDWSLHATVNGYTLWLPAEPSVP